MTRIRFEQTLSTTFSPSASTVLQDSYGEVAVEEDGLVTVLESTHSGLNDNNAFYPPEVMQRGALSWVHPYNKPVLKNHDRNSEPLGRVINSEYKQSIIDPSKETIQLTIRTMDADTIRKIKDGRYHTLSIGASSSSVTCSICARDVAKDGFCGHQRGKMYDHKRAYWIANDLQYEEISWVNVPADKNAQVIHKDITQIQHNDSAGQGGAKQVDDILDQLQGIASGGTASLKDGEDNTPETPENTNSEGTENTDLEGKTEPGSEELEPKKDDEVTLEDQLAEATGRVQLLESENTTLLAQVDTLTAQVVTLENEITELKSTTATAQQDQADAEAEKKRLVDQNATLASYTHRILAENLADMQIVLGKLEDDKRESTINVLLKDSSRSLKEKSTVLAKERITREIKHVDMSSTDNEEIFVEDSSKGTNPEEKKKEEFNVQDYAATLGRLFVK